MKRAASRTTAKKKSTKRTATKKKTRRKAAFKPLTGKHSDFSGIVLKAAARGDIDAVDKYLKHRPAWLNEEGPHGRTLLWEAAYKGRTDLVRELVRRGADLKALGSYYTPMLVELTPLAAARYAGRVEVVEVLKELGAKDDFGAACHRGDLVAMKRFHKRKPKIVNQPARKEVEPHRFMGYHPVHYAVAGRQMAALEFLVDHKAELAEHMPLLIHWADGNREIIRYLKSACPKAATSFPKSSFQKKATRGKTSKKIPKIDQPGYLGFPPLVEACRGNHNAPDDPDRVQAVLDQGADIHITDYKGKTALHRAAQAGFIDITKLLLKNGADVKATDDKQETPLFDAAYYGRTETVKLLLKHRAKLTQTNPQGETILFAAARRGHDDLVACLLERGMDPAHKNKRGRIISDIVAAARQQTPARKRILKLLAASK